MRQTIDIYSDNFSNKECYAINNILLRINAKPNFKSLPRLSQGLLTNKDNPQILYINETIFTSSRNIQILKKNQDQANSELKILKNYSKGKIEKDFIRYHNQNIIIKFDLFKLIFHFIARVEEYKLIDLDCHGRFKSKNDSLCKMSLNTIPIVDDLAYFLGKLLEKHFNTKLNFKNKNIWNGHRFAVGLSHDIDYLKGKSLIRYFYWGLKSLINIRHENSEAIKYFKQICRWVKFNSDPYWNLADIREFNEKNGINSTFFFLSLRSAISREGRRYRISKKKIADAIKELDASNNEVGLHASYFSMEEAKRLQKEKNRLENVLGKNINGIRNHYLRFKVPNSWNIDERLGFKYDSTMGWGDNIGFRAGTCWPFLCYDLRSDDIINILEIPLVVMDGAFDNILGKDLSNKLIVEKTLSVINQAEVYGGAVAILWHNNRLSKIEHQEYWKAYREIINYLKTKDVYLGTLLNIYKIWTNNFNSSL